MRCAQHRSWVGNSFLVILYKDAGGASLTVLHLTEAEAVLSPCRPQTPGDSGFPACRFGRLGNTLLIKTEKKGFFLRWAGLLENSQKSINSSITEHLNAIYKL